MNINVWGKFIIFLFIIGQGGPVFAGENPLKPIRETSKIIKKLQADNGKAAWFETDNATQLSMLYFYNGSETVTLQENFISVPS